MFKRKIFPVLAGMAAAACALAAPATPAAADTPAPAAAVFKGALDLPATINPQLALANRMTAVAQAGTALVAVGPRGHILVSRNGGADWKQAPSPVSSDLVAVRFLDAQRGWAVGHDGVVLHSADGGASWVLQLDGRRAARIAAEHAARDPGLDDEARDFAARFAEEGADKPLLDVLFINASEGFVVGAFNTVFRTMDGGRSWEPLFARTDNPNISHLYALAQHRGEVYAAGERGLLLRWDRAGERFAALASPYGGSFFGLLDTGDELLAYGLRGNLFASADGGASWRKLATPAPDSVVGGASLGAGRYALVTRGGRVLLGGAGDSAVKASPVRHPMPYAAVAAAGDTALVTAGGRGLRIETISAHLQEK